MDVNELKIFIEAIANRDQTGNSLTPDEFNSYLARANEDKFRIETGIREVQTPIFFQSNQTSTDAMRPFIVPASLPVTNGIFTIPADYRHFLSMRYVAPSSRNRIITALNTNEFDAILDDPVTIPTEEHPYATQRSDIVEVAPASISLVRFTYLKKPPIPFWGFTIINDEAIYDPTTSIQLGWADIYHIDIARIILVYLGVNFRDQDLTQYAIASKAQGS